MLAEHDDGNKFPRLKNEQCFFPLQPLPPTYATYEFSGNFSPTKVSLRAHSLAAALTLWAYFIGSSMVQSERYAPE